MSTAIPLSFTTETLLKRTTSRCPACHAACPAEVWKVGDRMRQRVLLRRRCPEHGEAEACISSDARFYWLAQGDPANACCGGNACNASDNTVRGTLGRNAGAPSVVEKLSTCLALIEIVHSCNLACPTCYADSPQSTHIDAVPLADLQRRIQGVIDRKGGIEILQLSGGEPTLHPQFHELLAWLHAHPGIDYVLLNTNGVRVATDDAFLEQLGKTFHYGKFQLYLQFDGPQEAAQRTLRGADLRAIRRKAIERCAALNIPITLAMTVTPENLPHLWETVEFGLQFSNVRGVAFQPMFTSGRNTSLVAGPTPQHRRHHPRLQSSRAPEDCASKTSPRSPAATRIARRLATCSRRRKARARSATSSTSPPCRAFSATRSATASKTCCNAAARANHSASCSSNSNSMRATPSASSSSPSWTRGRGIRTASTAAAPTSSAPTARSIPSAATTRIRAGVIAGPYSWLLLAGIVRASSPGPASRGAMSGSSSSTWADWSARFSAQSSSISQRRAGSFGIRLSAG